MSGTHPFDDPMRWTKSEKETARRIFDKALDAQCSAITAEVKRMIANLSHPSDIWRVHDYLSERRRAVDRTYEYRYLRLLTVFAQLLCDGWLTDADLAGFDQEKIDSIKDLAAFMSRRDQPQAPAQSDH